MNLTHLTIGLNILMQYGCKGGLDYVPNSFPNGAPANPTRCYINVEVSEEVSEKDAAILKAYGWISECEGDNWLFYG